MGGVARGPCPERASDVPARRPEALRANVMEVVAQMQQINLSAKPE
jgi:hypothetical protein